MLIGCHCKRGCTKLLFKRLVHRLLRFPTVIPFAHRTKAESLTVNLIRHSVVRSLRLSVRAALGRISCEMRFRESGIQNAGTVTLFTYENYDGRCLVTRQPALRSVREHFRNFTCPDLALNGAPEIGPKNFKVVFKEC